MAHEVPDVYDVDVRLDAVDGLRMAQRVRVGRRRHDEGVGLMRCGDVFLQDIRYARAPYGLPAAVHE